jgi:biopolymer transport protein ExbB
MQDPTLLAAGVSQALITTAAGMIVAIPALVAYRYFQRRIVDINAHFETEAGLMIQELYDYKLLNVAHNSAYDPALLADDKAGVERSNTQHSHDHSLNKSFSLES